jgi:hypothetical protein
VNQELNISLGNVDVNAERLTEFILLMRTADKTSRFSLVENRVQEQAL